MTPKKMKVPYFIWVIMSGVTCPTMKLFIQFEDAPNAIPYGRAESGQTSATSIHALGTVSLAFYFVYRHELTKDPKTSRNGRRTATPWRSLPNLLPYALATDSRSWQK
jgi:hypothetical protein